MRRKPILLYLFLLSLFSSCATECDDILLMHGVWLEGQELQEFYTVRRLNNDTINRSGDQGVDSTWATTIGSLYEGQLQGNERFTLHINSRDSVSQTYDFVYKNGYCAVEKVSGPSTIHY